MLGMIVGGVDTSFWKDKRVFLTGHTGFKGSWLSLWLQSMGADVHGFALAPPTDPALFEIARVAEGMTSTLGDIRELNALLTAMNNCHPEIVIHMAAQPLVRYSYQSPVETYAVNVMGTVHVLEAIRSIDSVRAVVNVTTDKCYENREWVWGYREEEPMGGFDPYSNSKGCSELVSRCYRDSFLNEKGIALATARAGNVVGGGDWASDRLIPDILRAFEADQPVVIRRPNSVRPWQHVLEPLSGYLTLAEKLYTDGHEFSQGWNFGPRDDDAKTVQSIVEQMASIWGDNRSWILDDQQNPHEAMHLKLDISKAKVCLGWQPRWNLYRALTEIIDWHKAWLAGDDMKLKCLTQIHDFQVTK